MYKFIRPLFFLLDAEKAHHLAMYLLKTLCRFRFLRTIIHKLLAPGITQPVKIWGLPFVNPVGLAAGFDKNACYLQELQLLGFGFVEIGTVTPLPQAGNEKPRLFRLPKDKALINRMGFNNDGAQKIAERLKEWKNQHDDTADKNRLIIGGNIGKNKQTPNEEAWMDYERCFLQLFDYVDYFVVNVSSPNTPGLRELQEKSSLKKILSHLQVLNQKQANPKPLLLKIAPDLSTSQLDDIIDLAIEIKLDGLVATNTTISRDGLHTDAATVDRIGAGGLSGRPVRDRSTKIVKYLSDKTAGKIPIIASGGIFTATDAKEKREAGATLIQVWTGFIYEGPGIVKNILKG